MIDWDVVVTSQFLEVIPTDKPPSAPVQGPYQMFCFSLPLSRGTVELHVLPADGICRISQIGASGEPAVFSAYIACDTILINDDLVEEGGDCVVLSGKAGHACISETANGFEFFFSMHGIPR